MINWRTVLGLILLLVGVEQLYTLNAGTIKPGSNSNSAEVGCGIWVVVGLYLIVRGVTTKKQN